MSENHFFLTGQIQVGKSTLIRRVLQQLGPIRVGGFRTTTVPDIPGAIGSVYIMPFGAKEIPADDAHRIGIRRGIERGFEAFPQVFEHAGMDILSDPGPFDLLVFDELGMMESKAALFSRQVLNALDGGVPILGVIKPIHTELLDSVRSHHGVCLFEVTKENREQQLEEVLVAVKRKLWRQRTDSAGTVTVRSVNGREPELLLVRSKSGRWGFPKGHIEEGERPEEAALRETLEETGIRVRISGTAPVAEVPSLWRGDHRRIFLYLAEYVSGELLPAIPEVDSAAWLPLNQAKEMFQGNPDREALVEALRRIER